VDPKREDWFGPLFGSGTKYQIGSLYVPASPEQFLWGLAAHADVPAEVPEDCRVLTVHRLWFPAFNHIVTRINPSGTNWSRQYHESTIVWCKLPLYHLLKCLLPLCHAFFVWKNKTKPHKRGGKGGWEGGSFFSPLLVEREIAPTQDLTYTKHHHHCERHQACQETKKRSRREEAPPTSLFLSLSPFLHLFFLYDTPSRHHPVEAAIISSQSKQQIQYYKTKKWTHFLRGYPLQ